VNNTSPSVHPFIRDQGYGLQTEEALLPLSESGFNFFLRMICCRGSYTLPFLSHFVLGYELTFKKVINSILPFLIYVKQIPKLHPYGTKVEWVYPVVIGHDAGSLQRSWQQRGRNHINGGENVPIYG